MNEGIVTSIKQQHARSRPICRLAGQVAHPILDNLATHSNVEAAEAIRDARRWFLYLPPYSPALNPIEQAFSKLKAHLRKNGARRFDDLVIAFGDICSMFSPQECGSFFHAVGYVKG